MRNDRFIGVRVPSRLVEKASYMAEMDGYNSFSALIRDLLEAYVKAHEHNHSSKKSVKLAGSFVTLFSKVRKG